MRTRSVLAPSAPLFFHACAPLCQADSPLLAQAGTSSLTEASDCAAGNNVAGCSPKGPAPKRGQPGRRHHFCRAGGRQPSCPRRHLHGLDERASLRRDGILSEKEFVAEKEGLAKQAREKQVQPAADGAHYPAAGASSQEDFRTHPGAPGWRQYTQADGSSYFWNVNTEKLQYPVPPGIPVADFLRSVPRACTPAHRGEHAAAAPILRLLRCIPCTRAKPRAPGQEMFF